MLRVYLLTSVCWETNDIETRKELGWDVLESGTVHPSLEDAKVSAAEAIQVDVDEWNDEVNDEAKISMPALNWEQVPDSPGTVGRWECHVTNAEVPDWSFVVRAYEMEVQS